MGHDHEENAEQLVERLAGNAGYACHEAVCAEHGKFSVITIPNGEKYYFGDDVNKYLLENDTSVIGFCNAAAELPEETVLDLIDSYAREIGSEDMKVCGLKPAVLYKKIDSCWRGIFDSMTNQYCQSPSEWPVLFGIVTYNLLYTACEAGAPKEKVTKMAIRCAAALSKMGRDTYGGETG